MFLHKSSTSLRASNTLARRRRKARAHAPAAVFTTLEKRLVVLVDIDCRDVYRCILGYFHQMALWCDAVDHRTHNEEDCKEFCKRRNLVRHVVYGT